MLDPIHIAIDNFPRASEIPLVIALLSLIVSIGSAGVTYHLNVRGRRSSWYHKVAVDPMLDAIFSFFDQQREKLAEAAIQNQNAKTGRKTPLRSVSVALNEFQAAQTELYEQIIGRIEIFDAKAAAQVTALLENHQDLIGGALFRSRDNVIEALYEAKKELMSAIRLADR